MAVCLTETEAEARLGQERVRKVAKTREAAEILSDKVRGECCCSYRYSVEQAQVQNMCEK